MIQSLYFLFFFFKQKTAYEMRISGWSSDVCSSDLLAERHRRVQRSHRLLVDHGDLVAAELAQLLGAELRHIAALVEDLAADDGAVFPGIPHDRHGTGRLAAARPPDQADAPPLVQGHVEVDHRRDLAGAREVGEPKVPQLQ